jgi:ATP-binding cassette subfamily A (ABC1) protein 5
MKLKQNILHQSASFDNIQAQAKKECKNFVFEMFPDAKVEESFGDRIVWSIPQDNVTSLAQCFEKLEKGEKFMKFMKDQWEKIHFQRKIQNNF